MKYVKTTIVAMLSFILLSAPAMAAMEIEEVAEILIEFTVVAISIFLGVLSISKISRTFEKESMLGKLANGFRSYVVVTIVLEIGMIVLWLYNEIVLGVNLWPKGISEIGFIGVTAFSYYILYKNISHFKSMEKREFGRMSVEDLAKGGFIKARGSPSKGLGFAAFGIDLIKSKKQ